MSAWKSLPRVCLRRQMFFENILKIAQLFLILASEVSKICYFSCFYDFTFLIDPVSLILNLCTKSTLSQYDWIHTCKTSLESRHENKWNLYLTFDVFTTHTETYYNLYWIKTVCDYLLLFVLINGNCNKIYNVNTSKVTKNF